MTTTASVPAAAIDELAPLARTRRIATKAVLGLALGLSLGFIGFGDYGELHRMFTLADPRLFFTFGGAVAVTALGLRLVVHKPLPRRAMHRSVPIGAAIFGVGWAVAGACPGVAFVQLGEGTAAALLTLSGMLLGTRLYDAINARWLHWDAGGGSCGS